MLIECGCDLFISAPLTLHWSNLKTGFSLKMHQMFSVHPHYAEET